MSFTCILLWRRATITVCKYSTLLLKPRPNDGNISTQHIVTLLSQLLQAAVKTIATIKRNIVGRTMLHAFYHPVATCWHMLEVQNRTSAHALAQHCCTNLAKQQQHHLTSTNVAWKIWPFSNLSQQHSTCYKGWPNACNMLHPTMLRYVVLKCCDRLAGASIIKDIIFIFSASLARYYSETAVA